jgi:hypothetical protein
MSTLENLSSHFCPVLQPIMTLELIEILERLKCVERMLLKEESECNLFSDFTNGSNLFDQQKEESMLHLQGNEIRCYNCTREAIFIIRKVFPD